MKIAVCCITYKRPKQLAEMLWCFNRQDYPHKELVILDDAQQYQSCCSKNWRLVSAPSRYRTMGEKRNACAELVSPDVDAIAIWDDDDLYLPWALSASVAALQHAEWSRPSVVLHPVPGSRNEVTQHETRGAFHAGWAYTRGLFERAGRYPEMQSGQDKVLAERMELAGAVISDPMPMGHKPFYIYPWPNTRDEAMTHLSWLSNSGRSYEALAEDPFQKCDIAPRRPDWIDLDNLTIHPDVLPRKF